MEAVSSTMPAWILGFPPLDADERKKIRAEREEEHRREIERHSAAVRRRRLESFGIPGRYQDVSCLTYVAETDEERRNLEAVKGFISAPGDRILLLCGVSGTGKTHLGCSAVAACGGLYRKSVQICDEYESGNSFRSNMTRADVIRIYSECSLLCVDEVGRAQAGTERDVLSYLIGMRYDNRLPTVLISNMDRKDMLTYFGKAVFDRLTEVCTSLEFTGRSRRADLRRRLPAYQE